MPSVLIVDDAAFMRLTIREILEQQGWDILGEAETGRQAVQLYAQLKPDVVTMDITMPEMDGLAALQEILSLDRSARVVICSAMGQQAMLIEAIEAGAKDFIVKPFKPERVLEALTKSLAA